MVRNYVRKTNRQNWSTESMNEAVLSVVSGRIGFKKAAQQFGVPQTTLERYVQKKKKNEKDFKIDKTEGKFKSVFSTEQELELEKYLKDMEMRLFGLTMTDFRRLAYELAVKNNCAHRFNIDNEMAGKDWMECFLKRHPTLTLRKPESTSGARAMGFNRVAVSEFFRLLLYTIDKYELTGDRIYNCDETGLTVNSKGHTKVLALKGKRQVGVLTSAERGETVTAEICFSASGAYMAPMLIFPRKRKQQTFEIGLPPGSFVEVSDSGWITTELFMKWFESFIIFSKATKESPVLLLLDGHSTHTKNLDLILRARENGVILLCFPPHTSHRIQPLDVSFMKPLSTFYEHEVRTWLRSNPGKVVTLSQISTLFGSAFVNAASMKTALNGFRKTGIWPADQNVFTEADYLPASTTDIQSYNAEALETSKDESSPPRISNKNQLTNVDNPTSSEEAPTTPQRVDTIEAPEEVEETTLTVSDILNPQPQCSSWPDIQTRKSSFPCLSPEVALPFPKIKGIVKRTNRKRGKTAVLTSTPYKNELEAALTSRKPLGKKKEKAKRKMNPNSTYDSKKKTGKRMLCRRRDSESSTDVSDAECLYCGEWWSKSVEGWLTCSACKKWAHNACAGVDSDDDEHVLVCEHCQ